MHLLLKIWKEKIIWELWTERHNGTFVNVHGRFFTKFAKFPLSRCSLSKSWGIFRISTTCEESEMKFIFLHFRIFFPDRSFHFGAMQKWKIEKFSLYSLLHLLEHRKQLPLCVLRKANNFKGAILESEVHCKFLFLSG